MYPNQGSDSLSLVIFFWLEASHRSPPNSRREDCTRMWLIGGHNQHYVLAQYKLVVWNICIREHHFPFQLFASSLQGALSASQMCFACPCRWAFALSCAPSLQCPPTSSPSVTVIVRLKGSAPILWLSRNLPHPSITVGGIGAYSCTFPIAGI